MDDNTINTILLLFVIYGLVVVHAMVKGKLPWMKPVTYDDRPQKKDENLIRKMSNQHLRRIIQQPISRN